MTAKLEKLVTIPVEKRSGVRTNFYPYKIEFVLDQLNLTEDQKSLVIDSLVKHFVDLDLITATQIHDFIFRVLKDNQMSAQADSYEAHFQADQAKFAKETNVQLNIERLFDRNEEVVHENANKDSNIFNTQRDLEAGVASRAMGLKMLPELVAKSHMRGDIHWHDLDYSPVTPETNCCLIDFDEMLSNGFKIGNAMSCSCCCYMMNFYELLLLLLYDELL